jgi:asparagine synthetase B (glutamine-hydrolysing)
MDNLVTGSAANLAHLGGHPRFKFVHHNVSQYIALHGALDGILHFASEVKAIYADPAVSRDLNLSVLDTYLSFGYMIGEETLFAGVRRLPPGHALVAENGETRLVEYWQFGKGYRAADDELRGN